MLDLVCVSKCVYSHADTHFSLTSLENATYFLITCDRVIKYFDLHKKCSVKWGERGIAVLEVDASAGIGDVLGALWEDLCP